MTSKIMNINNNANDIEELCLSYDKLRQHLQQKFSGYSPKTHAYKETDGVDAAVLIPLFFKDDQAHLLFTKRTDKVEHHKKQISFPGGRKDVEDQNLLVTALRETEEEVGIRMNDVEIIGATDRFLTNTHYMVSPYVGFYPFPYVYKVNQDEIDRLIEVPLLHLVQDDIFEIKSHKSAGYTWKLHYYHFGDDIIWGVTGFLLSNFLSLAFDIPRFSLQPR